MKYVDYPENIPDILIKKLEEEYKEKSKKLDSLSTHISTLKEKGDPLKIQETAPLPTDNINVNYDFLLHNLYCGFKKNYQTLEYLARFSSFSKKITFENLAIEIKKDSEDIEKKLSLNNVFCEDYKYRAFNKSVYDFVSNQSALLQDILTLSSSFDTSAEDQIFLRNLLSRNINYLIFFLEKKPFRI